jgi:hypothetical protein
MRWQRLYYRIGSWAFVLLGAGHLLTQWFTPRTTGQEAIFDVMRKFAIDMPGSEGNLYRYHMGFSSVMGVLLIAYGAQALLIVSNQSSRAESDVRLLALHTLVSAMAVVLSVKFFFLVPIVFMAVAFASFGLGLFLARRAPW